MLASVLIYHADVYVRLERVHVLAQGHVHILRDFRLGVRSGVVVDTVGIDKHPTGVVAQIVEGVDQAGNILGRHAQAGDPVHERGKLRAALFLDGVAVFCFGVQSLAHDVGQVALLDEKITEMLRLIHRLKALDAGGVEGAGADIKFKVELGLMLGFCAFVAADVKICGGVAVVMHDSTHSSFSFHCRTWLVDSISGKGLSGSSAQPYSCGCGLQK